jgi:tetratricopeptide (TPR) repeat protein
MRKVLLTVLSIVLFSLTYGQPSDYFNGKWTYCNKPIDERSLKIYALGLECIRNNMYLGSANEIFRELIKTDSTFCDAYFFTGYTYRLSGMNREAVVYYYMADSLANNKSIEFKQNLATTSMMVGLTELSRKKFEEIIDYFPNSPEGYYGIALTSTEIGDFDYGLVNINIAINKYQKENKDAQFMKAILLTLNSKHQEAIAFYEKVESAYRRDDYFNGNYALSLYEVAKLTDDGRMMRKAKRHYQNVRNKNELTSYIKDKFE